MQEKSFQPLTVLYDGACPLCRREIAHAKGLADQAGSSALSFVDISEGASCAMSYAQDRPKLLARFHVERSDGSRLNGAAAFVAMWERLPGWRWLAKFARWPGATALLELAYRGFLKLRPMLQTVAHWFEPRRDETAAQRLATYLEQELRSDHAGETGAVSIYRGIAAVAAWRGNAQLLEFAARHQATETEHLRLLEERIAPSARSKLLGPWRLAGWLTGALPALFGSQAVYATIAAVETFVDQHYQQQIDALRAHPHALSAEQSSLLALLERCQADEIHHRDEASALCGKDSSVLLRVWCGMIDQGSKAAVALARRL
jgi:3-demethoxyubiquinol 3-hydroxylase